MPVLGHVPRHMLRYVLGRHVPEHIHGHVLKHMPEYVLKHVPKHVLRHIIDKHVLNQMAHAVLMT